MKKVNEVGLKAMATCESAYKRAPVPRCSVTNKDAHSLWQGFLSIRNADSIH
jgi:hypothetical protein